jgi:hypothetical protein
LAFLCCACTFFCTFEPLPILLNQRNKSQRAIYCQVCFVDAYTPALCDPDVLRNERLVQTPSIFYHRPNTCGYVICLMPVYRSFSSVGVLDVTQFKCVAGRRLMKYTYSFI